MEVTYTSENWFTPKIDKQTIRIVAQVTTTITVWINRFTILDQIATRIYRVTKHNEPQRPQSFPEFSACQRYK